jgi:hypothetical protein
MGFREQSKYFEALKRYERKLNDRESSQYKMFLKRHKDEEELDRESLEKLKELYEKYYINRERKIMDDPFKKDE